jgi:uncharacterized protein (DUF362 family)
MEFDRRLWMKGILGAAPLVSAQTTGKKLGIPGPFPGRVIAVNHPGSAVAGRHQAEPVREMVARGMKELTGATDATEAWRYFFESGDVVGIKVNPVGQPYLISSPLVMRAIIAGLESAGVKRSDIFAYDRYHSEFLSGGFDKWLPDGVRWETATTRVVDGLQLDMDGYDRDVYMEMALLAAKADPANPHHRRSYAAKFITKKVNKVVTLGVVKHHQSAGATIALKNISHGFVNNVARSHVTSSNNACGMFIPTVVDMAVFRQKIVLHLIDGVMAAYHGGPGRKVGKYLWEHKTMYFATDPVAVDTVGLSVIDIKRGQMGMETIADAKPDQDSLFVRMQPEFIEISGLLGLGIGDESKIELRKIALA